MKNETKSAEYANKLKSAQWQKKRLKIMERDGFKCYLCGNDLSELHVHHLFYDNSFDNPWEYPDEALLTICNSCHKDIHNAKIGSNALALLNLFRKLTDTDHGIVSVLVKDIDFKVKNESMTEKEAIKMTFLEHIRNS